MVFVLSKQKKPVDPIHPSEARKLLKQGKAVVHKQIPFTIRMKVEIEQPKKGYRIKLDPGSKTTGLAISRYNEVIFLGELHHRTNISSKLQERRERRRNRRNRKLRYRPARWNNRKRKEGWLSPSLISRVNNIRSFVTKFSRLIPVEGIDVELVKFDTQLMQNPEISGVEYQQGELVGYEVREYLLMKFGHQCAYCEEKDVPLEVEHATPKSRGGSNRVSNLTIACRKCNQEKDNLTLEEWYKIVSKKRSKRYQTIAKNILVIQKQLKTPLKDAAAVNSTRKRLVQELKLLYSDVQTGRGSLTKMNRIKNNLRKEHYFDALCVGFNACFNWNFKTRKVLSIKAKGRGSRYRSRVNKFGFPIKYMPKTKYINGYISGDMVKANVPKGKYKGQHLGFVSLRSTGNSDIKKYDGSILAAGINTKYMQLIQRFDGYAYGVSPLKAS